MKYYIGLDWGEKKIGVAFGDDQTRQAFGLGVIENTKNVTDVLETIAQEYETDTFVIGLSAHHSQRDNVDRITSFATHIQKTLQKSVLFAPEMFSTAQAHKNMKAAGKKNITHSDDMESARIILQGFLDHLPT